MERPGESTGERLHLAFLFAERDQQRRPGLFGVFAAEALGGLLLPVNLLPARDRGDIHRDGVVEKRQPGQMRDDAGARPLRPATQGQHGMKMTVEVEPAALLADALAVPAVFLHRQLRVEQPGRVLRGASRVTGVEKPSQAGAMFGVRHRMHGRLRPEHCPQRAREFLELPGQFLQHDGVVLAEPLPAANIAGVGIDFNREEDGEMLAPQGAVQGSRPVAGEPLIADGADGGVGDFLRPRMIGQQSLPVVGIRPPLNLQPPSG